VHIAKPSKVPSAVEVGWVQVGHAQQLDLGLGQPILSVEVAAQPPEEAVADDGIVVDLPGADVRGPGRVEGASKGIEHDHGVTARGRSRIARVADVIPDDTRLNLPQILL
jgi:hypothetical protein